MGKRESQAQIAEGRQGYFVLPIRDQIKDVKPPISDEEEPAPVAQPYRRRSRAERDSPGTLLEYRRPTHVDDKRAW